MTSFIRNHQKLIYQFLRFAGIGFLNTAVDISFLNILIAITGITAGLPLSVLVAVSFMVAVMHSYWWNKFWAFGEVKLTVQKFLTQLVLAGLLGIIIIGAAFWGANKEAVWPYFVGLFIVLFLGELILWKAFNLHYARGNQAAEAQRFIIFIVVSIGAVLINSVLVGLITEYISPFPGFNEQLWANAAKALAIVVSLIWNFVGYKLLVFKK